MRAVTSRHISLPASHSHLARHHAHAPLRLHSRIQLSHERDAKLAAVTTEAPSFIVFNDANPSKPMRRLVMMRHADSEESGGGVRDHDRPLTATGTQEATKLATKLAEVGWIPDLIIASNARRTRQTLDVMAAAVSKIGDVDAHFLGSLYTVAALDGQTRTHLDEVIRDLADDKTNFCVMCIGHNKGWEEAASVYTAQTVRLKTANAALLQHAGSNWDEVLSSTSAWQLVDIVCP